MDEEVRVRACLAVVDQQRILLLSQKSPESGEICWNLPGGGVNSGEGVSAAAVRSFGEETGLSADVTGILDVEENILPAKPYHNLTVTFLGRLLQTFDAEKQDSAARLRWFSINELKEVNCSPRQSIFKALELE